MKLGRFISEVYRILIANQGATAGEVFMVYRVNNPNTIRSRNEVAKRISELRNLGLVDSDGTTVCGLTSCRATRWIGYSLPFSITLSTEKPEKSEYFVDNFATPSDESFWAKATSEFEDEEINDDTEPYPSPEDFQTLSRDEKAKRISAQAGEQCLAMDPADVQMLHDCRIALGTFADHPLLKALAPADLKEKVKKLEQALRYF